MFLNRRGNDRIKRFYKAWKKACRKAGIGIKTLQQKTRKPFLVAGLKELAGSSWTYKWCRRPDSNRHERGSLPPQDSVSTSSTTSAISKFSLSVLFLLLFAEFAALAAWKLRRNRFFIWCCRHRNPVRQWFCYLTGLLNRSRHRVSPHN